MLSRFSFAGCAVIGALLAGCGSDESDSVRPTGVDGGSDSGEDRGTGDGAPATAIDGAPDASDGGPLWGDATGDAGNPAPDSGDAAPDGGDAADAAAGDSDGATAADAGMDAGMDAGTDTGADAVAQADSGEDATMHPDAAGGAPDASIDGSDAAPYVPDTGGYAISCPWLEDTSQMLKHLLSTADFYTSKYDAANGGYYTYLDRAGNVTSTNKSFQVESRDAYAFAHAFMVSGNEAYLTAARQALDFNYHHAWDTTNGGFVFLGDSAGNWLPAPPGVPSDKWSFTEHYCLAGPTAMCEATGNTTDCGWMNTGMALLESHYWDPTYGGYFNNANLDYSSLSEKGFYPTVDGLASHIFITYLITESATYRARLLSLADEAVNNLVGSMTVPGVVFGFPEGYNADWSIEWWNTYGFVGHLYKTAWGLARAYVLTQDTKYSSAARQILMQEWSNGGFDHQNGAPNYDYNFNSGLGSTNKEYWELEESFTAGITNWSIATSESDRAIYAETADRSLCFYMQHMVDPQYGGVYFTVNTDGTETVDTDKSDQWEGMYHDVEFSYYVYVYGNLLLWHRPVTLYYRFDVATQDRSVTLTPIEAEAGALAISGVTLAGSTYASFDGPSRTVTIPAGTGGVFAVTFARTR